MAAIALSATTRLGQKVRRLRYVQSGANDGNVDFEAVRSLLSLTAQLRGTLGAGTVALQGSNDNSNFVALPTAVSFSAVGIKSVAVADLGFLYYRVAVASSNGSNDITLDVVIKEAL